MVLDPPLNAWPHFDPVTPDIFFVRMAKLFNAWMRALEHVARNPDAFSVAMVTQADMEAAFKTTANGDEKQAFNIYQWHWNPRGLLIYKATGIDVRSETSFRKIVVAALWELHGDEKRAFAAIDACDKADDASRAACINFEGAGAKGAPDRRAAEGERVSAFLGANMAWVKTQVEIAA